MNEKQITIDSKLFAPSSELILSPLHEMHSRTGTTTNSIGVPQTQTIYASLISACVRYIYAMEKEADAAKTFYSFPPEHLALGRNSSAGGGEETFVEFDSYFAHYNPTTGMLKVSRNSATEALSLVKCYLVAPKGEVALNGELIWLAVLPTFLADGIFAKAFANLKDVVLEMDSDYQKSNAAQPNNVKAAESACLSLCNRVKELLIVDPIQVKLLIPEKDTLGFEGLRPGDIKNGKIGPSMSKIVLGQFKHFKTAGSSTSTKRKSYSKETVKKEICSRMKWVNPCKTPMELALIPHNDGIVTQQIVDMVSELVETQDNPLATRLRFFLIEGPAGVGKSFNARMFAELNERPFVVQTLSPTDQKEDLIGGIVPITKGETEEIAEVIDLTEEEKAALRAINESDDTTIYDNVAAALGYPSAELCKLDPEGAWESVTGQSLDPGQTVSIPSVIGLINRKVLSAVVSINNKCKDNAGKLKEAKEREIIEHLKEVRTKTLSLLAKVSIAPDNQDVYASCKKEYDALISDEKVCCYPPLDFSVLTSLFMKSPEMAMPYIPGYNGNRDDFLPKYEKETEVEYRFIPSPFVRAFQNGWVCELQEATCLLNPSALSGLHDALEPESMGVIITPYGEIRRHPDFVCIATQNRKYPGTKPLNPATRSRFQYFDCPDALTKTAVMNRIGNKCNIKDKELLKDIAEVFKNLESCARNERMSGEMTMRAAFTYADALNRGKDVDFARTHYALCAISTDEDDLITLNNSISDCQGRA